MKKDRVWHDINEKLMLLNQPVFVWSACEKTAVGIRVSTVGFLFEDGRYTENFDSLFTNYNIRYWSYVHQELELRPKMESFIKNI